MPYQNMETWRESEQSRYRWLVLAVSLFAFVAYAFAFQSVPPLIRSIKTEFNIQSDAQAGLLMSIVLVPGIFLSIPAGLWISKYGLRRVGIFSLVLVTLGSVVTALAGSFADLLLGRLVLGIGGAFALTATPAAIAQWFSKDDLGKAMGIFGVNMPLATVMALPTASALLLAFGWRFPFYASAAMGIVASVAYSIVIKEGPFAGRGLKLDVRPAVSKLEIWKVGLVWLFFNAAALSFTTWAPHLFEEFQKMPSVQASLLASLLMWSAMFCVPIFGYLSDRAGRRKPFVSFGFILMALAFAATGFTSDLWLVASVLFLGVTAAMIPPIVSTLPAQILGPKLASVGFGITGSCLNIGAALAQPLIGLVLDATRSYSYSLLTMSVLAAIGTMAAFSLETS